MFYSRVWQPRIRRLASILNVNFVLVIWYIYSSESNGSGLCFVTLFVCADMSFRDRGFDSYSRSNRRGGYVVVMLLT